MVPFKTKQNAQILGICRNNTIDTGNQRDQLTPQLTR